MKIIRQRIFSAIPEKGKSLIGNLKRKYIAGDLKNVRERARISAEALCKKDPGAKLGETYASLLKHKANQYYKRLGA